MIGTISTIERPRCPYCLTRMLPEGISSAPAGCDVRKFTCNKCDRVSTKLISTDPMKTADVVRWLEGDLKRPS